MGRSPVLGGYLFNDNKPQALSDKALLQTNK